MAKSGQLFQDMLVSGITGLSEKAEISYEKEFKFKQKVHEIVHKNFIYQIKLFLKHFLNIFSS
jgi:hypothetical protein